MTETLPIVPTPVLSMWTHATSIKVIDRVDGRAKVYILARHDGFYEYRVKAEVQGDEYDGVYWFATEQSGLFASAEEAERAALDDVPWLRQKTRKEELFGPDR